jgi:hypothetical protein
MKQECPMKGSVVSLQNFPYRTNPFWNMRHKENSIFNKVDVILYGQRNKCDQLKEVVMLKR